jgi:hypothetical protein
LDNLTNYYLEGISQETKSSNLGWFIEAVEAWYERSKELTIIELFVQTVPG